MMMLFDRHFKFAAVVREVGARLCCAIGPELL